MASSGSVPGPCEPEDLIDGIIFAANYLGSTQLLSERNPSKNIRMMQAQEAVSRVKVLHISHTLSFSLKHTHTPQLLFLFFLDNLLFCLEGRLNISHFPSGVCAALVSLNKSTKQNIKGKFMSNFIIYPTLYVSGDIYCVQMQQKTQDSF